MPAPENYGTLPSASRRPNGDTRNATEDQERAGLLGSKAEPLRLGARLRSHLNVNVSKKWGDLILLFCYFITGLLDSSSVIAWGSFVSMQTGNTIYLGYGLSAPNSSNRWLRALISLAAFALGSFSFARFHRYFTPTKRWVLVTSYLIQTTLIIISAVIVTIGPQTSTDGTLDAWSIVPIALLALQAAGQAVVSRVLKFGSLTSVVLTSLYCDLFSDAELFAGFGVNLERNRRATAPVMLMLGALVSGVLDHSRVGLAGALWTAVGAKALIVVAWCFWAGEKDEE